MNNSRKSHQRSHITMILYKNKMKSIFILIKTYKIKILSNKMKTKKNYRLIMITEYKIK